MSESIKYTFRKGNKIKAMQDFCWLYNGIPSNLEWTIDSIGFGKVRMTAEGYGVAGNYGNGAIFAWIEDLPNDLQEKCKIVSNVSEVIKQIKQIKQILADNPQLRGCILNEIETLSEADARQLLKDIREILEKSK